MTLNIIESFVLPSFSDCASIACYQEGRQQHFPGGNLGGHPESCNPRTAEADSHKL